MSRSRASVRFEGGMPALMTVTDFAFACGISRPKAKRYIEADSSRYEVVGETKMVPARVLYEFLGVSESEFHGIMSKVI